MNMGCYYYTDLKQTQISSLILRICSGTEMMLICSSTRLTVSLKKNSCQIMKFNSIAQKGFQCRRYTKETLKDTLLLSFSESKSQSLFRA